MASLFKRGKNYAVVYRLKGQQRRYVFGITTKRIGQQIKLAKERDEQLSRAGLLNSDPDASRLAEALRKPLEEHIADFERDVLARGAGTQHAHQQASHVRRLVMSARIQSVADIRIETVQLALHKLLGTKRGPRTCNAARQAIIQWEKWLQKTGRISRTVLQNLSRFNQNSDIRRKRRALSQIEVDGLLATTAVAKDRCKSCGISPASRARMYAVGICTGFRRAALLSLTRESFFVSESMPQPFVRLAAPFNKNRRHRDQAIPCGLAAECREWLKAQPQEGPLWRPLPHADLALRFRRDMEAARTAWINEATTAAEREQRESSNTLKYVYWDGTQNVWADFHSLRHTAITFAVRGVGLRAAQEWADHSTPVLTANYSEVDPTEVVKAAQSLPNILALTRTAKHDARSA